MKALLLVVLCAFGTGTALAQECGPNPELTVSWNSNLRKAVIHQECKASSGSGSLTIDDVSLGGSGRSESCANDSVTDEQAQSSIQTEIKNQKAAIVATCGYYACVIPNDPTRLAFLSDVCAPAIGGGVGSPLKDFRIEPRFLPVVVASAYKDVRLLIRSNSNGTLTIAKPISQDENILKVVSPDSGQFTVPPKGERLMVVRLFKPSADASPLDANLDIHLAANAGVENSVSFAIASDRTDFLSAPTLGCGTINPGMTATAFSDVGPGGGFPPKPFRNDALKDVPVGTVQGFARDGSEYHNNGGGEIWQTMDSSCSLLPGARRGATSILSFVTSTIARSGHCCSGLGPGGMGKTSPTWTSRIDLPGDSARDKWSFVLIVRTKLAGASPACGLAVDGSLTSIPPNEQKQISLTLNAGPHVVSVGCDANEIGARPGGWDTQASFRDELNITVSVLRR